jgi:hypothetical protein
MKKRNIMIIVFMLIIGFAAVSTTLVINGRLNIGYNEENFSSGVVYTRAETEDGTAEINQDDKNITFETKKLENVSETATLEFDVTNKSRNYDASVTIKCGLKENFESFSEYLNIETDITSPFRLESSETKTGRLVVTLKKAYDKDSETTAEIECELVATPEERETLGDEYKYIHKEKMLNGADPVIKENLVPVTIADNGEVTYANTQKKWYSYENKEWANAVILVDSPSKEYQENDIIPESDIESYFVWIPRYKYQIFDEGNYTEAIQSKPETSIATEIQIEFESNSTNPSAGSKQGEWLTHPAFTNFDVNGFWVGKFETGYEGATSIDTAQVNAIDSSKVIVKPNVYSWRSSTVSNMFKTAYDYERNLDSHMMKNTEWGAVAYLSHSKYGINTEVRINNNSNFLTGYSAVDETDQSIYPGEYGTDSSKTLPYNISTGYKASTTGNITGIYDMSGGAWEYVGAYMPSSNDASGFSASELTTYSKYLDLYPNNTTVTSWNNRILGDATGEMGPFYYYADEDSKKRNHNSWYKNDSNFVESINPWFARGGAYNHGIIAGQFFFGRNTGDGYINAAFRLVLTSKI